MLEWLARQIWVDDRHWGIGLDSVERLMKYYTNGLVETLNENAGT